MASVTENEITSTADADLSQEFYKRILVRIDRESIKEEDLSAVANASALILLDDVQGLHRLSFKPSTVDHALLLLGQLPDRFGYSLSFYLTSAQLFLHQTRANRCFVMPQGTSDFKKRFSEDLAVTLASIFMVSTFALRWSTIGQIQTGSTPTAKKPDFAGYDSVNTKRVYEAKGTTSSEAIEKARTKAKEQLEAYRDDQSYKYAIICYVASEYNLIPSMMFISDPPADPRLITLYIAAGLHLAAVLGYCGFAAAEARLRDFVSIYKKIEQAAQANRTPSATQLKALREVDGRLRKARNNDVENAQSYILDEHVFIGRWLLTTLDGNRAKVFVGVEREHLFSSTTAFLDFYRRNMSQRTPFVLTEYVHPLRGESLKWNQGILSDGTIFALTIE